MEGFRSGIMTTAIPSLGFVPMAVSQGAGGEAQRTLALVIIDGLTRPKDVQASVMMGSLSHRGWIGPRCAMLRSMRDAARRGCAFDQFECPERRCSPENLSHARSCRGPQRSVRSKVGGDGIGYWRSPRKPFRQTVGAKMRGDQKGRTLAATARLRLRFANGH